MQITNKTLMNDYIHLKGHKFLFNYILFVP